LSPELLRQAAWPLAAAGAVALAAAIASSLRGSPSPASQRDLAGKRPFDPRHVLGFVAILASIMLLAAIARHWLGEGSLPWVLAASGLADVHAAAASAAQQVASGHVQSGTALFAILAALGTNSLMKCIVALLRGGAPYARRIVPGIVLMVAAFAGVLVLT